MVLRLHWHRIMVVLLILLAIVWSYDYYLQNVHIVAPEVLDEALAKSLVAETYRYKVNIKLLANGLERPFSEIQGERVAASGFHLKGKMQTQDVEVYQIGNTTYMKSPDGKRWMVTPGNEVFQQQLFMAEVNPLASFNFTSYANLEFVGREKTDRGKTLVFTVTPTVKNEFLERWFQDFRYKVWVGARDRYLHKAEVQAVSRNNPSTALSMIVELSDFNAPLKITAPTVDER